MQRPDAKELLISIHALLAESDELYNRAKALPIRFLSTLSLRRATSVVWMSASRRMVFLSTLSLRRATARCQQHRHPQRISIHALLAESDVTMSERSN